MAQSASECGGGLRVQAVGYGTRGQLDGGVWVASAGFRLLGFRRTDRAYSGTGCGVRMLVPVDGCVEHQRGGGAEGRSGP